VQAAADEVAKTEPAMAMKLEKDSADKLKAIGVKVVENVDKSGFMKAATPLHDHFYHNHITQPVTGDTS
jgi:TRAP-type C4-dicarboxylate transport system substrate-binding protein